MRSAELLTEDLRQHALRGCGLAADGQGHNLIDEKLAARAGIFSAVMFTIILVGQSILHPEYSQVSELIGALPSYSNGWIQSVSTTITGAAMFVFALGLCGTPLKGFGARAGPVLLAVAAVGITLSGLVPSQRMSSAYADTPGHAAGAIIAFLVEPAGLILCSLAFFRSPGFRKAAVKVLSAGLITAALSITLILFAVPEDGPLHAYQGLIQRLVVLLWLMAVVCISGRLLDVSRRSDEPA